MSLANVSDLKTAIGDIGAKTYTTAQLDRFIALAESRIVRDVKTSELELTTTMTVDASSEALPADYAGLVRIKLNGDYPPLDYIPSDSFHSRNAANSVTGRPTAYTIEANNILFAPAPDDSYTATYTYFQKPDLVTDTTNRLMTLYPDVYLFACMIEVADFEDDERNLVKYEQRYNTAIQGVNGNNMFKGTPSIQLADIP